MYAVGSQMTRPVATTSTTTVVNVTTTTETVTVTSRGSPVTTTSASVTDLSSKYPIFGGWFGVYLNSPQLPAPTGIAAYGLANFSGTLKPYVVGTRQVVAKAEINSLDTYNSSLPTDYQHGASLQLNVMLEINTTKGAEFFWLQNTDRFDTANGRLNAPRDLIFNNTGSVGNPILRIYGGKGAIDRPPGGQTSYIFSPTVQRYSLPLSLDVGILVSKLEGKGIEVSFYNQPFGGGYFDNVTISLSNVVSAAIVVSPYPVPPNLVAFDAEFVWVAYCCDYATTFYKMDSSLSLAYANATGTLVPFPALYSFGTETAELASNLRVTPTALGGHVVVGQQDNSFLKNFD